MIEGSLTERVYRAVVEMHPVCSRTIADTLGASVNDVAGRVSLLKAAGRVHVCGIFRMGIGGEFRHRPFYAPGPLPEGLKIERPTSTRAARDRRYREKQKLARPPQIPVPPGILITSVFDLGRALTVLSNRND